MPDLAEPFYDALTYAARLHARQKRKGTDIPYVSHLLAVAGVAIEHGASEDEAIAALLHDAVEDQGGEPTLLAIRKKFGRNVADIVDGCSDTMVKPKPPWQARKEQYIAHVRHASPSIRLVSAADKLHNARAILADYRTDGEQIWERFNVGRGPILWHYRALVAAFQDPKARRFRSAAKASRFNVLVRELDLVVSAIEALASETRSTIETEMKWRLAGANGAKRLRAKLTEAGALYFGVHHEVNRMFDRNDDEFRRTGRVLRLRTINRAQGGVVTFKGKAETERGFKSRRELELDVSHGATMHGVLVGAGFALTLEYPKTREVWRMADDTEVVIDKLPFGYFCEIEGSKEGIRKASGALGLDPKKAESGSYPTLMAKHIASRASTP